MPSATLPRPLVHRADAAPTVADPAPTVADPALQLAATRWADAVTEFDAALDAGSPMYVLVRLDQEVTAAGRHHREVLAASRAR